MAMAWTGFGGRYTDGASRRAMPRATGEGKTIPRKIPS